MKKLRLSDDKMILGVCGGIAEYFGIDPTVVRVVFALLCFAGAGIMVYFIIWLVIKASE